MYPFNVYAGVRVRLRPFKFKIDTIIFFKRTTNKCENPLCGEESEEKIKFSYNVRIYTSSQLGGSRVPLHTKVGQKNGHSIEVKHEFEKTLVFQKKKKQVDSLTAERTFDDMLP